MLRSTGASYLVEIYLIISLRSIVHPEMIRQGGWDGGFIPIWIWLDSEENPP